MAMIKKLDEDKLDERIVILSKKKDKEQFYEVCTSKKLVPSEVIRSLMAKKLAEWQE